MNQDNQGLQNPSIVQPPPQPEPVQNTQPMASISPETPQKFPMKKIVLVSVILFLIVAGTVIAYVLLQKPKTQEVVTDTTPPTIARTTPPVAHYIGSEKITMSNVSDDSTSGTATLDVSADTISTFLELPEPPEGQFFQAWALNTEADYRSIGKLLKNNEGRYVVTKNTQVLPSDFFEPSELYNIIVVSLEVADDNIIETRILQGTFKVQ